MRAVVVQADGVVLDPRRPEPADRPGHAVLAVRAVSVGRLELEAARGLLGFTGVPGTMVVGEIISGAQGVGRRVAVAPVLWCGTCDRCRAGLREHCADRRIVGLQGCDGGLADRLTVPVSALVDVPTHLPDDAMILLPFVMAALRVRRVAPMPARALVTVLGDGPMAHVCAQVLRTANPRTRVLVRHPERAVALDRVGIRWRPIDEAGTHADQDLVVECTGATEGLDLAARLVRPRGRVVVLSLAAALRADPGTLARLVLAEIDVTGGFAGPVREAIDLLARDGLNLSGLVTQRLSLEEAVLRLTERKARTGGTEFACAVP